MSGVDNNDLLNHLCLATKKILVSEFLEKTSLSDSSNIREVKLEDIPEPHRTHEKSHAEVLKKYGIKYVFGFDGNYYLVQPIIGDLSIFAQKHSREEFINMLIEFYEAPSCHNLQLGYVEGIRLMILTGQLTTEESILTYRIKKSHS